MICRVSGPRRCRTRSGDLTAEVPEDRQARPRRPARSAAGDHRRRGCARFRRRRVLRSARRAAGVCWWRSPTCRYYVRPGTALDGEAQLRGNSVYFPERVIPMLPEMLSNGLCSLNPEVDRLCMVCEMLINREGKVTRSRFLRRRDALARAADLRRGGGRAGGGRRAAGAKLHEALMPHAGRPVRAVPGAARRARAARRHRLRNHRNPVSYSATTARSNASCRWSATMRTRSSRSA